VASPHFVANIASLRNEVEQHHFERSEKHHIATRRCIIFKIQGYVLLYLPKCGIIEYNKKDLSKEEGIYNAI